MHKSHYMMCVAEASSRELDTVRTYLDYLISATPTGAAREKFTDAQIHMLAAQTAVREAIALLRDEK